MALLLSVPKGAGGTAPSALVLPVGPVPLNQLTYEVGNFTGWLCWRGQGRVGQLQLWRWAQEEYVCGEKAGLLSCVHHSK